MKGLPGYKDPYVRVRETGEFLHVRAAMGKRLGCPIETLGVI